MSKDNGGPAFPTGKTISKKVDGLRGLSKIISDGSGMTLRDYFAAKAMQGLCADPEMQGTHMSDISRQSYELADAMLAERAK